MSEPRRLPFTKMHGAGNDFVMVDAADLGGRDLTGAEIARICDRRLGVGADGLIVLEPGDGPGTDFGMVYFNSDGREAEMCGNGARCTLAFAHERGRAPESSRFATASGVLSGRVHGPGDLEIGLPGWRNLELDPDLPGCPWAETGFCNTGVPHLIVLLDGPAALDAVDLPRWGPVLRGHPRFAPAGTNVNWVARDPATGMLLLRTYERGVEAETLACGTGASAAAVVVSQREGTSGAVPVRTRGGDVLTITVGGTADELLLRGPAVTSFRGEVILHG